MIFFNPKIAAMSHLCDFQIHINGLQTFFVNEVKSYPYMETAAQFLIINLLKVHYKLAGDFINIFREVEEDHQARKEKSSD